MTIDGLNMISHFEEFRNFIIGSYTDFY